MLAAPKTAPLARPKTLPRVHADAALQWSNVRVLFAPHGEVEISIEAGPELVKVAARALDDGSIELADDDESRDAYDPLRVYVEGCAWADGAASGLYCAIQDALRRDRLGP